jgi:hypothetical protein
MYGPIADLWDAFQEKKLLVEQECDAVSNLIETDSANESQRAGEEVSESWQFRDNSEDELGRASKSVLAETLVRKLRWATVGVQFDWSKVFRAVCFGVFCLFLFLCEWSIIFLVCKLFSKFLLKLVKSCALL